MTLRQQIPKDLLGLSVLSHLSALNIHLRYTCRLLRGPRACPSLLSPGPSSQ